MESEAVALHEALEKVWELLFGAFAEARFERRPGLRLALFPTVPIPQCNGPWVVEDSQAAVEALPGAIAEVDAIGVLPWVQTRAGHELTQAAARELGLTHVEVVPGMVMRPGELVEAGAEVDVEISLIADGEVDETNAVLAAAFEAPKSLFDFFCEGMRRVDGVSWYVGRASDAVVSTAVGLTVGRATGIFNVATPPEHRGRGYGAALTARAVRDGFAAGAEFAYLQSSETGHGVYRRLGFRDVEEYTLLARSFAAE